MDAISIGLIVMVLLVIAALAGIRLRLPLSHMDSNSRDVVKSVMGLIATMAALVLSLLIASAKSSYDAQSTAVHDIATKLIMLDRMLAHYGPETREARGMLRETAVTAADRIWPTDPLRAIELAPAGKRATIEAFYDQIQALVPHTDAQKSLQSQALQISLSLGQTRMLMYTQSASTVPVPFLVILVFWVTALFIGFGLFAEPNPTALTALVIGALSVSGAIFLILELDQPYSGILRIPDIAVRGAIALMGR